MEEERQIELHRAERALLDDDPSDERAQAVIVTERPHALKSALEALERELAPQRRGR